MSIDTSAEPDAKDTIDKMQVVQRAALAPADPSAQDRAVAAKAARLALDAGAELLRLDGRGAAANSASREDRPLRVLDLYV